jgi:hypothetical protein
MPDKWYSREGDWRLVRIEGSIGFAPEKEQYAEDPYRDGDDAWIESHDPLSTLLSRRNF